jgi:hypothetical protein
MRRQSLAIGLVALFGAGMGTDLLACGDKFLVIGRGTRFQNAAVPRPPATILIYANPASTLPNALGNVAIDATLSKAGYRPTVVASAEELDKALRQGGWDLVVADVADGRALRSRLQGSDAPFILPVVYNPSGSELAQLREDFQRVLRAPTKRQSFLESIDDALAFSQKL